MNAISGPSQSIAIASLVTNAPVTPVRRVLGNAQRTPAPAADRWERSSGDLATPVTYGRDGRMIGASRDVDGDAD